MAEYFKSLAKFPIFPIFPKFHWKFYNITIVTPRRKLSKERDNFTGIYAMQNLIYYTFLETHAGKGSEYHLKTFIYIHVYEDFGTYHSSSVHIITCCINYNGTCNRIVDLVRTVVEEKLIDDLLFHIELLT